MKNPDAHDLIAGALKGELTPERRREFDRRAREDAAFRELWRAERALERALDALPDAPVPSNFTHLVMQGARRGPEMRRRPWLRVVLPKLAFGVGATALIALTVFQQQQKAEVRELAESVSAFNKVAAALGTEAAPEVFANFEAIRRLNLPAESELDMELMAALQP